MSNHEKRKSSSFRFEAQHYTNEDGDLIRAKMQLIQSCPKSEQGLELQGEDFAQKMVDLLHTKTPKELKDDKDVEAKGDESTKKSRRRKQMARKGMHTSVDENDSEDSDEVGEQEESTTCTETPINHVPVAMKH
ncbi:hypothetical protein Tco_0320147 [Tanacetum coccineum]